MQNHGLSIEDRLERAYTACQAPVEEIFDNLKEAIREHLLEVRRNLLGEG